ncbi:MAG: NAD(P)/FAD-dependent oxidoreductase [Candidatus Kapaibacterium sp.]
MTQKTDYIILGAGLAGTMLAELLRARGRSVRVIDNGAQSSSMVAGGLMNPLTGKRLVLDEEFGTRFELAQKAYADVPGALQTLPVFRVLSERIEHDSWVKKQEQYRALNTVMAASSADVRQHLPCMSSSVDGCTIVTVPQAGLLNTAAVISKRKRVLAENNELVTAGVSLSDWDMESHALGGVEADKIVICDGWHLSSHPLFASVPTMCAKGQLLTVRIPQVEHSGAVIIHGGRFLAPLGNSMYRYGATYEWNDLNETVLESTTEFLLEGLRGMIDTDFIVVDAHAGVRPIIRDVRPVMGVHPTARHVSMLNGMGSKGALLAPTLAAMLVNHLEDGVAIPEAFSLERFL